MNITYRQTQSGKWLVCEAKPHTLGVGVQKVGTPSGGYTTGYEYDRYDTESEAANAARQLATERGWQVVEWIEPVTRNQDFIDLPDGEFVSINADKTVEWYRGEVLKNVDITPYPRFGYEFALTDMTTGDRFLVQDTSRYSTTVLKNVIRRFRECVDARLGQPRGRNGGRPQIADEPQRRHNITISDSLWQRAEQIGDGNASDGIRRALEVYSDNSFTE